VATATVITVAVFGKSKWVDVAVAVFRESKGCSLSFAAFISPLNVKGCLEGWLPLFLSLFGSS
jgi:hypothetical protein